MSRIPQIPVILRRLQGFRWEDVPDAEYKPAGDHFRNVRRVNLAGMRGENTTFHVRYFEIGSDCFTSREHHQHEHVIVVLRGEGELLIGDTWQTLHFGDVAYVPPGASHQLRNNFDEPFGFLCVVDTHRDRPVVENSSPGEDEDSLCRS